MPSAIDVDRLSRHIGRLSKQKMHGPGDVVGGAFALERRVRNDPLARQFIEGVVVGPEDRSWRHGIYTNLGRELARERSRESDQARLGDAVNNVILQRPLGVNVSDVDDRSLR